MLEMFPSPAAQAEAAAAATQALLVAGLRTRGRATLAATGGRSPGAVYDRLAMAGGRLDWARVVLTLTDERCVAPEAAEANARLVRERLLQGEAARAHFLPLWPAPDPAQLAALLPFDAVLLGMGEDGHIASLIPGMPGLAEGLDPEGTALLMDTPAGLGAPPLARVTLTVAALTQARGIFLLIAGEAKRQVLARAQAGEDLPVRALLAQARAPLHIFWAPEHAA